MSAAQAVFDAVQALYVADAGAGGLNNSTSAARVPFFDRDKSAANSPNIPKIYVDAHEEEHDPFGGSGGHVAVMINVTFHLYTRRDRGFAEQNAVLARMRTVYKGVAWGVKDSWTMGIGCRKRGFQAASTETELHYVEQYTTIANFN